MTSAAPDELSLPPRARMIAARIEDAMHRWHTRSRTDPTRALPSLRAAIDETGQLIVACEAWREQLLEVCAEARGTGHRTTMRAVEQQPQSAPSDLASRLASGSWWPEQSAIARALEQLWCQGVDAAKSPDFRRPDGTLDELAYLRYQENALSAVRTTIEQHL